ncbi:hypothetical protein [Actinoplanes solisilvae]|uniref:hypothetical protein n=1 Tax=Actinoplanes solisilvae TaxID=2486853 RepID=UPI000FDAE6F8|nr:hypothetical protein [Actinoplanes solisilvae]
MRNRMRSTIVAAAVVLVLLISGAAFAAYSWTRRTAVGVETAKAAEPTVKITGAVAGLVPGKSGTVNAVISNDNDFAVRVDAIKGGNKATDGGCPEWAVRVVEPTAELVVPARSTKKFPVRIRMEEWADEKCAGRQFSLDVETTISPA